MKKIDVPKENAFTFIRLLLCLFVILDHTWQLSGINSSLVTNLGRNLSVPAFFILSGFWVTMSCLRSSSVKEYGIKRFKKIFPSYWIVIAACAVVFVFFTSLSAREYFTSPQFIKYLAANFSTLNFLCINLPGTFFQYGIDGALWSIKIEIGFYIVLPVILIVSNKIAKKRRECATFENTYTDDGGGV